ncbi:hypothetical protein Scep_028584 [Stephania cephalantha]|uniref:Receptor-interacting protein n=1 Tax=Stephania cephalantha TaxID=152367 RepID=A0AAP0HLY4_9MAGN
MLSLKPCRHHTLPSFQFNTLKIRKQTQTFDQATKIDKVGRNLVVRVSQGDQENRTGQERKSFLSLEEAGLVEISGLSTHERFLCRLTISSLNLLRVISEQEGCPIEELNAGKICDWFVKDKLKREQNLESAVLQWDDSQFQI